MVKVERRSPERVTDKREDYLLRILRAEEALRNLPRLIEGQEEELKDLRRQVRSLDQERDLVSQHKNIDRLNRVFEELRIRKGDVQTPHEDKELEKCFAGEVFENLAYMRYAFAQPDNLILLSPERTSEFCEYLYFDNNTDDFAPDGLVIEKSEAYISPIIKVFEDTLVNPEFRYNYFAEKIRRFEIQKNEFPRLFRRPRLVFVTPGPKQQGNDMVKFIPMPFTRKEFGEYIKGVYAGF